MIRFSCFVILLTITSPVLSCRCVSKSYSLDIQESDLIFSGTFEKYETRNSMTYYTFNTTKTWKGVVNRQNTIYMDVPWCGMRFKLNKEYLVFSTAGGTHQCRNNTLLDSSLVAIFNFIFRADSLFRLCDSSDSSDALSKNDINYFNFIFQFHPGDIDLTGKQIAFSENSIPASKKRSYALGVDANRELVLLSTGEKTKTGLDAIIVVWNESSRKLERMNVFKWQRKMWQKRFTKKLVRTFGKLKRQRRANNNG